MPDLIDTLVQKIAVVYKSYEETVDNLLEPEPQHTFTGDQQPNKYLACLIWIFAAKNSNKEEENNSVIKKSRLLHCNACLRSLFQFQIWRNLQSCFRDETKMAQHPNYHSRTTFLYYILGIDIEAQCTKIPKANEKRKTDDIVVKHYDTYNVADSFERLITATNDWGGPILPDFILFYRLWKQFTDPGTKEEISEGDLKLANFLGTSDFRHFVVYSTVTMLKVPEEKQRMMTTAIPPIPQMKKSVHTALCIIPLFPFVADADGESPNHSDVVANLGSILQGFQPFSIRFRKVRYFDQQHGKSTLHLVPEAIRDDGKENPFILSKLIQAVERPLRHSAREVLARQPREPFGGSYWSPHLTLGQCDSGDAAKNSSKFESQILESATGEKTPIEFRVDRLYVVSRPDGTVKMAVCREIPLLGLQQQRVWESYDEAQTDETTNEASRRKRGIVRCIPDSNDLQLVTSVTQDLYHKDKLEFALRSHVQEIFSRRYLEDCTNAFRHELEQRANRIIQELAFSQSGKRLCAVLIEPALWNKEDGTESNNDERRGQLCIPHDDLKALYPVVIIKQELLVISSAILRNRVLEAILQSIKVVQGKKEKPFNDTVETLARNLWLIAFGALPLGKVSGIDVDVGKPFVLKEDENTSGKSTVMCALKYPHTAGAQTGWNDVFAGFEGLDLLSPTRSAHNSDDDGGGLVSRLRALAVSSFEKMPKSNHRYREGGDNRHGHSNDRPSYWAMGFSRHNQLVRAVVSNPDTDEDVLARVVGESRSTVATPARIAETVSTNVKFESLLPACVRQLALFSKDPDAVAEERGSDGAAPRRRRFVPLLRDESASSSSSSSALVGNCVHCRPRTRMAEARLPRGDYLLDKVQVLSGRLSVGQDIIVLCLGSSSSSSAGVGVGTPGRPKMIPARVVSLMRRETGTPITEAGAETSRDDDEDDDSARGGGDSVVSARVTLTGDLRVRDADLMNAPPKKLSFVVLARRRDEPADDDGTATTIADASIESKEGLLELVRATDAHFGRDPTVATWRPLSVAVYAEWLLARETTTRR